MKYISRMDVWLRGRVLVQHVGSFASGMFNPSTAIKAGKHWTSREFLSCERLILRRTLNQRVLKVPTSSKNTSLTVSQET